MAAASPTAVTIGIGAAVKRLTRILLKYRRKRMFTCCEADRPHGCGRAAVCFLAVKAWQCCGKAGAGRRSGPGTAQKERNAGIQTQGPPDPAKRNTRVLCVPPTGNTKRISRIVSENRAALVQPNISIYSTTAVLTISPYSDKSVSTVTKKR